MHHSVTTKAFVCARATVPSPRTDAGPGSAPAGIVTVTFALPVFDVRSTNPTWTQRPSTSHRIRTGSFRPKPRSDTLT